MFTFLSSSIVDAEGIVNYATGIIRNDHPHYAEVMKEITSTIQLLSQKPIEWFSIIYNITKAFEELHAGKAKHDARNLFAE